MTQALTDHGSPGGALGAASSGRVGATLGVGTAGGEAMESQHGVQILLVDDRPDKLLSMSALLGDVGATVITAQSGKEALRQLLQRDFAVILLDVNMPGMDGFETAALIRQRKRSEHTPIIFFTAQTDTETHASRGYSLGAVDYIHSPVIPEVLRTKIRVFVELFRTTETVRRQAEEMRRLEAREHQRRLDDAMSLVAAEAKRNLFFVLSIDLLCIAGFDGFFKQLNPAWGKLLAFTDDELMACPLIDWVHPDDRVATAERLDQLRSGTPITYFENRFRSKDGGYRWLGWTASPFAAEALLYMFARDITDRKRAEEERARQLIEEQRRAAQLEKLGAASRALNAAASVSAMLDATVEHARMAVGAQQAIVHTRAEGRESTPRHLVSLPGMPVQSVCALPPAVAALFDAVVALNRPLRLTAEELEIHPQLGPPVCEAASWPRPRGWLSTPLRGRDGRAMGMIQVTNKIVGEFAEEDASLLSQLAEVASVAVENALYREALEANRLKDEFLAILSHELRAPLNPILMWVQMLRTRSVDQATTTRALDTIERNVKAQAQIISDLLDVSRIVSGKLQVEMQPVDLPAVIEAAVEALRPAAESKNLRLEVSLEPPEGIVQGDPDRLQQVVWNLVANAVKFTPAGGSVWVRLRRVDGQEEIEVRDTGEGISPEFLPHVFERFRQADPSTTRAHGGLGLGLAIVRHLVEVHGGTVRGESEGAGQGARFTVRLPIAGVRAEAGPAPQDRLDQSVAPPRVTLEGLRILVVDDEADTREALTSALARYGASVTPAASVSEALAAVRQASPDLIVSDVAMPGQDGYSLIRELRAAGQERVPAVALTAYARAEDRERALSAGFQAHLAKPVEAVEIARLLMTLAARRACTTPSVRG